MSIFKFWDRVIYIVINSFSYRTAEPKFTRKNTRALVCIYFTQKNPTCQQIMEKSY